MLPAVSVTIRGGMLFKQSILEAIAGGGLSVALIRFKFAGPDRRIALRERSRLSETERKVIQTRLTHFDASRRYGPWTIKLLRLIHEYPALPAGELAALAKVDKAWLKVNVRKLKELGLTESLMPSYRLSPRGRAFLARVG